MSVNDIEAQAWWRIAVALSLTATGQLEQAEERAREAVMVAARTDGPMLLGDTMSCLGEVLGGPPTRRVVAECRQSDCSPCRRRE
jgi:hypothetical protein